MKKVLLADRDRNVRSVAAMLLARAGFHVIEAVDGSEALVAAQVLRPDLILFGDDLPGLPTAGAEQLLKTARGNQKTSVLSFAKPFSAERLLAVVRRELA